MEGRRAIPAQHQEVAEARSAQLLTARRRSGLAVTCCAIMCLYAVYFGALGLLLPLLGKAFGLGPEVEGRLFPADFGGFVVGVLVYGLLSDRLGRKTALLLGIACFTLGLAVAAAAPNFGIVLLASVLIGGGSGAMEAVASALASDLYPERRAFFLNVIQVAFGVGAALSPALIRSLLASQVGWRALYFGFAAVNGLLFFTLSLQFVPRPAHSKEALDFAALLAVLKRPAFGVLCLAQALYVGAEMGFFTWLPTYFKTRLPGGGAWEGYVVTVFWVAMTVGRLGTGGLVEHLPLPRLLLLMAGSGALSSGLTLVWHQPLFVTICVALVGLCFAGIFGVVLAEAGNRFSTFAGTVFGGVVAAGGLGGAVIPWAVGALATTSLDWRGALALIPGLMLMLACIALWLERS